MTDVEFTTLKVMYYSNATLDCTQLILATLTIFYLAYL